MLGELQVHDVQPEQLFVAHCVKADMKVNFTVHYKWDELRGKFKELFLDHLSKVLKGAMYKRNHLMQPGQNPLPLDRLEMPEGLDKTAAPLVRDILHELVSPNLTEERYLELCTWLAVKYIATPRSQENAYIVLRFWVHRNGIEPFPMVFVTLVELDPERDEPYINVRTKELALQHLENAFNSKAVVKGAVYPYIQVHRGQWTPTAQLMLHEQEGVGYWPNAFECGLRLRLGAEKNVFWKAVGDVVPEVTPSVLGELTRQWEGKQSLSTTDMAEAFGRAGVQVAPEKVQRAVESEIRAVVTAGDEVVHDLAMNQTFEASNVIRGSIISIKHGTVDLSVPTAALEKIDQFYHGGQYYLVVRAGSQPLVANGNMTLSARSWESFKQLLDNRVDNAHR